MKNDTEDIKKSFDAAEKIGVVGSPSSTSGFSIDILGTAVSKRLVGNLSVFGYQQDNQDHYALGQITEIEMQNTWTQDPTMRGIIRQKGRVDPITERQDVHIAKMIISSVFARIRGDGFFDQSILGTVPPTGTPIRLLSEAIMNSLLANFKDELFYLGKAYGTSIKMPMWFKHFGPETLGTGEAYHIGIFGKTGSGKSILAEMIMLGYARHKNMSILVLDPQGQFSTDLANQPKLVETFAKLGKVVKIFHINNIVLDDQSLFIRILAKSKFWEGLVRSEEYRIRAGEILLEYLLSDRKPATLTDFGEQKKISIFDLHDKGVFEIVWRILHETSFQSRVYSKQYAQDFKNVLESGTLEHYYDRWLPVAKLFTWKGRQGNAIVINRLIREEAFTSDRTSRPIIIIDLSKENVVDGFLWNEDIQTLTIKRILDKLTEVAEEYYKRKESLNGLVVIDEAHRLAPRESLEDESLEEVKGTLIDSIRTTRKYGLGWMFISQTLSSLDREIINQIRIYIFGFGLAWGIERQALRELIGGADEAIRLYQLFRDPQSSLGRKEYPFMSIGPISPLSFSGAPLFFTALNYPSEFLKVNFSKEQTT